MLEHDDGDGDNCDDDDDDGDDGDGDMYDLKEGLFQSDCVRRTE